MEFKKKRNKKKLFIISIILLAVGVFAYFNKETVCWALFIIGAMLFNNTGMSLIKEKLDKSKKERYMPTEATAFWISFIAFIIGMLAFVWIKTEENKVEDTKPYYNILAPSHGTGTINRKEMEEYLDEELYYSELRSAYITDKKNEWIDDVNKCLDDIVGERKNP